MVTQGKISFELFAPYNEQVSLLGDWNGWQPIPMTKNEHGYWQVEIPLDDGFYEYQFEVTSKSYFAEGQKLRIADPTAICLTRDQREHACLTVKNGQEVITMYQWQHDQQPLPPNSQLVIYELHVGDFYNGGDNPSHARKGCFLDVIQKLDYLVDLGINAIELMPVNEFPEQDHWGYSQRSLYAVENTYGSPDDLCRLIDECHARGIRIILDAVYNHMEMEAPLTQIDYTYWFYRENPDDKDLQFGPKFNYQFFDDKLKIWPARDHAMGAMKFWINTFHLDGIRFDAARALKHFDLMSWINTELHQLVNFKPFITIAEYIPENPGVAGPTGPMDTAWHENLSKQLMCTIVGVPKDDHEPFNTSEILLALDGCSAGYPGAYNMINYIDDHDQDRILWQIGHMGNCFDDAAFRRMKLGAALLFTSRGIPMIFMGQEFGEVAPRTLSPQPLDWVLLKNDRNADLHDFYRHLIDLHKKIPALTADTFKTVADFADRSLIAYKRWDTQGSVVLVVANLKDQHAGEVVIQTPDVENGTWREQIYDYDVQVQNQTLRDTLGESEVKIYVKRP